MTVHCKSLRDDANTTTDRALRATKMRVVAHACDNKRDAFSVYGQFDGRTDASGKERAANLAVGRVFSTGIAAQNVSHAARMIAHTDCVKAIRSVFPATGKEAEALAAITVNCPLD